MSEFGEMAHFDIPRRTLARAKKHVVDLERERHRFIEEQPWTHAVEMNYDRGCKEYKVKFSGPLPDDFDSIASDALVNLRNVLDQCGAAASRASGRVNSQKTAFPFGETPQAVVNAIKGWAKDVPPTVTAVMSGFKPYKTGNPNPLLWTLNKLANVNKHGLIRPMGAFLTSLVIGGPESLPRPLIQNPPVWNSGDNEIVYAITAPGADPNPYVHLKIDVSFAEINAAIQEPALNVLYTMADEVERVLMAVEAETQRLFPAAF